MDDPLPALRASVGRLYELCRGLDDGQLDAPSYCSDWTIAGVLSHLGSAAVIMEGNLGDAVAGRSAPEDFASSVWDQWNAKSTRAKMDDALVADEGLLEALEAVSEADRARVSYPFGPLTVGFDQAVGFRLNEHALHTWDIEVVLDDGARLPFDSAAVVVDNLELITRFAARPNGEPRTIHLRTTGPDRVFALHLAPGGAELTASGTGGREPDLVLPAEALCRLVYGRLDPEHTPVIGGDPALLWTLRAVFPGI